MFILRNSDGLVSLTVGLVGIEKSLELIAKNGWCEIESALTPVNALVDAISELAESMSMVPMLSNDMNVRGEKSKEDRRSLHELSRVLCAKGETFLLLKGPINANYAGMKLSLAIAFYEALDKYVDHHQKISKCYDVNIPFVDQQVGNLISILSVKVGSKLEALGVELQKKDDTFNFEPDDIRSVNDKFREDSYGVLKPITDAEFNDYDTAGHRLQAFLYENSESSLLKTEQSDTELFGYWIDKVFDLLRVIDIKNQNVLMNVRRVYGLGSQECNEVESLSAKSKEAMRLCLTRKEDEVTVEERLKIVFAGAKSAETIYRMLPTYAAILTSERREMVDVSGQEQREIDVLLTKDGGNLLPCVADQVAEHYYLSSDAVKCILSRMNRAEEKVKVAIEARVSKVNE